MLIYVDEYIKSDLYRYYEDTSIKTLFKGLIRNRSFREMYKVRLCQNGRRGWRSFGRLWLKLLPNRNVQISPLTKLGYGLYIAHGGPVIVNETATIGNNCNLSQFCTIGVNNGRAAVIGDNVYIGPNVCVVEDVTIGNNVTVGAGSVVTKNIPDNATIAGNYAKVLNYANPGRYVKSRWNNVV